MNIELILLIYWILALFCFIVWFPYIRQNRKRDFLNKVMGKLKEKQEEDELVASDKTPTDEHINLYYKMYMKKWELDHVDEWETDLVQPMTFEKFEGEAKKKKYYFLVASTSDMFIGMPPVMVRYRNYKKMVEKDVL